MAYSYEDQSRLPIESIVLEYGPGEVAFSGSKSNQMQWQDIPDSNVVTMLATKTTFPYLVGNVAAKLLVHQAASSRVKL
jgi:hypothetical protein